MSTLEKLAQVAMDARERLDELNLRPSPLSVEMKVANDIERKCAFDTWYFADKAYNAALDEEVAKRRGQPVAVGLAAE